MPAGQVLGSASFDLFANIKPLLDGLAAAQAAAKAVADRMAADLAAMAAAAQASMAAAAQSVQQGMVSMTAAAAAGFARLKSGFASMVAAAQSAGAGVSRGLLQISYAIDDLQYGIGAIVNNLPQIALAFGGKEAAMWAGGIGLAAVAVNILVNHWQDLADRLEAWRSDTPTEQLRRIRTEAEAAKKAWEELAATPTPTEAATVTGAKKAVVSVGAVALQSQVAAALKGQPDEPAATPAERKFLARNAQKEDLDEITARSLKARQDAMRADVLKRLEAERQAIAARLIGAAATRHDPAGKVAFDRLNKLFHDRPQGFDPGMIKQFQAASPAGQQDAAAAAKTAALAKQQAEFVARAGKALTHELDKLAKAVSTHVGKLVAIKAKAQAERDRAEDEREQQGVEIARARQREAQGVARDMARSPLGVRMLSPRIAPLGDDQRDLADVGARLKSVGSKLAPAAVLDELRKVAEASIRERMLRTGLGHDAAAAQLRSEAMGRTPAARQWETQDRLRGGSFHGASDFARHIQAGALTAEKTAQRTRAEQLIVLRELLAVARKRQAPQPGIAGMH